MKKFINFLLIFTLFTFTPKVKALEMSSIPVGNENINKTLYKENNKELVAVFKNKQTYYITNDELSLIAKVVYAESRGEPYNGKVAVASVILNRLESPDFPNTLEGVIKQKNAFSCVRNGKIDVVPDKQCYNAVLDAINGDDPTSKALFFYNPKIATCNWMKNIQKKNIKSIGNHVFFAIK